MLTSSNFYRSELAQQQYCRLTACRLRKQVAKMSLKVAGYTVKLPTVSASKTKSNIFDLDKMVKGL
jgi:hypothetical protein